MAKQIIHDLENLPKSRAEALRLGAKWYFTGKPCKHGHLAARDRGGRCTECHRLRMLAEYHEDPEPTRQRSKERERRLREEDPDLKREQDRKKLKAWRNAYPEKALAQDRAYRSREGDRLRKAERNRYARDPEKFRNKTRNYRNAHPGYATEQNRDWRNRNPDAAKANEHNKRAREKAAEGRHTAKDIKHIRAEQDDRCALCERDLNGKGHIDHIMPLALGGTNWPDNLQLLCAPCNLKKWAHPPPLNLEI